MPSSELRPVNTEIDLTAGQVVRAQAEAMSTGKYSLVAGLFNQNSPVPKTSGHLSSHSPSQGVKAAHSSSSKSKLDDENNLNVSNEIIEQIVTEKESHQAYGPTILENLTSAVTKVLQNETRNGQKEVKKLKNKYLVTSNFPKFYVHTLNEEIIEKKNIHHYYKRNDKQWFDLHNIVLRAASAVIEMANLCLEADNKNEVIHSKDVVVKAIDAITLLGKPNHQMTFERKERF